MSSSSGVVDVYEYSGNQLVGTSIAFLVLNIMFVALRFAARRIVKCKLEGDDYLVLGALFANLILEPVCIALVYVGGVGHHVEYWIEVQQNPEILVNWGKILLAIEQTYLLANLFAKLAILVMYIRIFTSKPALYTSYTLAGIVIAAWLGSTVAGLAQCRPFWCSYDKSRPQDCTCIDILAFFRYISLPNIITDVVMLILPLPTIWQLKLSRSQKLGLTGAFLTGSIGLISSIVRFAIFSASDALSDPTWKSAFLNIWTVTEPSTYLIAACLPVLRPLLRHIRAHTTSTTSGMSASHARKCQSRSRSRSRSHSRTRSQSYKLGVGLNPGRFAARMGSRRLDSREGFGEGDGDGVRDLVVVNARPPTREMEGDDDERELDLDLQLEMQMQMQMEVELGQVRPLSDSLGDGHGKKMGSGERRVG